MIRTLQKATKRFVFSDDQTNLIFPLSEYTVQQRRSALCAWLRFISWSYQLNHEINFFHTHVAPTDNYTALVRAVGKEFVCSMCEHLVADGTRCVIVRGSAVIGSAHWSTHLPFCAALGRAWKCIEMISLLD